MNQPRLQAILNNMEEAALTQLLISDPSTIFYLTGQWIHPGERMLVLLLRTDGAHRLFANDLFLVRTDSDLPVLRYSDTQDGVALLAEHTDSTQPLGVDKTWPARFLLRLMELCGASAYVNASACADRARACKDAWEQEQMREASRINDRCMLRFRELLREGVTEAEVAAQIRPIYLEEGAEDVSFPPIVAFGQNAADSHHMPDATPLRAGDCIVLDVGCVKDGYCSDMTRTYFFREVSDKHRMLYDLVLRANEAAEALVHPGVPMCALDAAARDLISAAGYGPQFHHRLGHSIGFECHEAGDVSAVNHDEARPGMIFSIEPGIYLTGEVGIRIEDLVLVTPDGVERLNRLSKELEIVGC